MVSVIQTTRFLTLTACTACTGRPSHSQILSSPSLDRGTNLGLPGQSVSMDIGPSPVTRLFASGVPSSSAFNPPLDSTAIFGDPASFFLPLAVASSSTKERPVRSQSPASPSPPRQNLLAAANPPLSPSKDRVPSSASPEALKFPQLRPEGLDPEKMKGLAGNIGALLLGSKRRAEDDGSKGDMLASSESMSGSASRKRPRRPITRAKVRSSCSRRSSSCAQLSQAVSDATSTPPCMQPPSFFANADDTEESQTPLDDRDAGGVSCGVHYDDPSSRVEKKRLMSLLNGQDESQAAPETVVASPAAASVKKATASKKMTGGRRKVRARRS